MSKVDQKRNWVKFKSVRKLLRIACVADRKSYVVIICASLCEKFTKDEIGLSGSLDNMRDSGDKAHLKFNFLDLTF